MKQLLAIEWLKLKRYTTFWVLIGLFVVLLPLLNYEVANGFLKIGGGPGKGGINVLSTAYSFPDVWGNMGFWGSLFINFLAILVIILTTNEYNFRTNRQNVIDGWSRLKFYHAKVTLVVVLSLLATVFIFIVGAIFGRIISGSFNGLFNEFQQVGYFFILSLDYLGFALFIAIWIRKSGLAIGLFILYSFMLENILKFVINHYSSQPYGNLLMLQSSDELLPFQLMKMMKGMIGGAPSISMSTYALVTMAWCVVYYLAGRIILLRSDW